MTPPASASCSTSTTTRALAGLMTNLAGHDIDSVLAGFGEAAQDERPACLIAYTIKGFGLPFAGHKDNHAGMMTPEQMADLRDEMGIAEGAEWEPFAGLDLPAGALDDFLAAVPFNQPGRAQPPGAPRARAGGAGAACRCPPVDAGRVRAAAGGHRAQPSPAGGPHRHDFSRRHGIHQPGRLG